MNLAATRPGRLLSSICFHRNGGKKNVSVNGPPLGVPADAGRTLEIISLSKPPVPELAKSRSAAAEEFGVPALGSGHAGLLSHRGL
jgi:hypothetical protein